MTEFTTETFNKLQHLLSSEALNNSLNEHPIHTPVIATPAGVELRSLEPYLDFPIRNKNKFTTGTPTAFNEYANEYADDNSVLFIDDDKIRALAIFDYGTKSAANWKNNTALYAPEGQPEYEALLRINRQRLSQKTMAEFIEDYGYCIEGIDSKGDKLFYETLSQLIRNIKMLHTSHREHAVEDYSAGMTAMETIDAKSKDGALPQGFIMTCSPHEEFEERAFSVRFSISTDKDNPRLIPRIISLDQHKQEMIAEARDLLASSSINRTFVGTGQ